MSGLKGLPQLSQLISKYLVHHLHTDDLDMVEEIGFTALFLTLSKKWLKSIPIIIRHGYINFAVLLSVSVTVNSCDF